MPKPRPNPDYQKTEASQFRAYQECLIEARKLVDKVEYSYLYPLYPKYPIYHNSTKYRPFAERKKLFDIWRTNHRMCTFFKRNLILGRVIGSFDEFLSCVFHLKYSPPKVKFGKRGFDHEPRAYLRNPDHVKKDKPSSSPWKTHRGKHKDRNAYYPRKRKLYVHITHLRNRRQTKQALRAASDWEDFDLSNSNKSYKLKVCLWDIWD